MRSPSGSHVAASDPGAMEARTAVIALDHPSAFDAARVGRKAATLAVARAAGLPAGPGVVLTTEWSSEQVGLAHEVWRIISHDGALALVVRRSPTARTTRVSKELSAVGAVRTVTTAQEFAAAVDAVHDRSTAVLVQPLAEAAWRGVVFGDGPTTDRRTRPVVACVAAAAPAEVWVAEIDHHGRTRDVISADRRRPPAARPAVARRPVVPPRRPHVRGAARRRLAGPARRDAAPGRHPARYRRARRPEAEPDVRAPAIAASVTTSV